MRSDRRSDRDRDQLERMLADALTHEAAQTMRARAGTRAVATRRPPGPSAPSGRRTMYSRCADSASEHPGGQSPDAGFVIDAAKRGVVEHERIAAAVLGIANKQRVVARGSLPCNQTRRIGDAIVAQASVILAGAGAREHVFATVARRPRRRRRFDRRIDQEFAVRIEPAPDVEEAERIIGRHADAADAQPSALRRGIGHNDVAFDAGMERKSGFGIGPFDIGASQAQARPRARRRCKAKAQRQRRACMAFVGADP